MEQDEQTTSGRAGQETTSEPTPPPIAMTPIGIIHSGHTCIDETPVQPVFARGCRTTVEVFPEYAAGLQDIEGFSHLYLLFYMDRAQPAKLVLKPFLDDAERGVFATRSPWRPNGIGLSVVELLGRNGSVLEVDGVDILDGTALLDIKPYTARFDTHQTTRNGWQDPLDEETILERGRQGFGKNV